MYKASHFNRLVILFSIAIVSCASKPIVNPERIKNDKITEPESFALNRLNLFLLIGQSNMAGRGVVEAQDKQIHPRVFTLTKENTWAPAVDPIHFDKSIVGVGLGRTFGITLADMDSSITIGLIPCAVGGSPISSWEPTALDTATNTHPYDDMLKRLEVALKYGKLKAALWYQGESDAHKNLAPLYKEKLKTFFKRLRDAVVQPDLPILIGQLGRFDGRSWSASESLVNAAHIEIAAEDPNSAFVPSEGLQDKGDLLHFNSESLREFGQRYAEAYLKLTTREQVDSK